MMKDNAQGFAEEEAKKKMLEESGQGSEIIPKEKGYKFDQRLQLDRLFERQTQQDNNITEEKPAP